MLVVYVNNINYYTHNDILVSFLKPIRAYIWLYVQKSFVVATLHYNTPTVLVAMLLLTSYSFSQISQRWQSTQQHLALKASPSTST